MPARIRLLLAVLIVALSAWGGAAYAAHAAADSTIVTDRPVADLDLDGLLGTGDADKRVIETAYEQVRAQLLRAGQHAAHGRRRNEGAQLLDHRLRQTARNGREGPLAPGHATGSSAHDLALIEGAVDTVSARYPQAGDKSHVTDVALSGMLGGLGDPYTTYLNADAIRALDEELKGGNFGGIGVYIGKDPKSGAILVDPIEGNPADSRRRAHRRRDRRGRQSAHGGPRARRRRAPHPRPARHGRRVTRPAPSRQQHRDDPRDARGRARSVGAREDRKRLSATCA